MHDWLFTNLGTFTWGSVENMRSAEYGEWKMRSVENEELCISVCFTFFTTGWYVVSIICPIVCLVCFLSADCRSAKEVKEASDNILLIRLFG